MLRRLALVGAVLVAGMMAAGPAHAVRLPLSDHRALVVPCGPDSPFPTGRDTRLPGGS